jgi:hypothetical protein
MPQSTAGVHMRQLNCITNVTQNPVDAPSPNWHIDSVMKKLRIPKQHARTVFIHARIDMKTAQETKDLAQKHGFLISDIVRTGLEQFISQYREKKKKSA